MTRLEIHQQLNTTGSTEVMALIEQVLHLSQVSCEGCIFLPEPDDTYPEYCGMCSRFYGDHHTTEAHRND